AFQGVRALWRRDEELFAEVAIPENAGLAADDFGMHPAMLDAVLHAALLAGPDGADALTVPFAWEEVRLHKAGASVLLVRVSPTGAS
ncbi:hypothetical protein G3I24_35600, partial [Micromonospora aurantiaca]|nr:hypothetical protein [Micromonospora aurantiaca]